MTTLVLLAAVGADPASWAPVVATLDAGVRSITPALPVEADEEPFTLSRTAAAVTDALSAAEVSSAVICGVGLGAMVALQLAAAQPDRVTSLVLVTRQVRLSPLVMSLPAAVLRLVPAAAVQRLGAARPQVLALLDQVRPVDATPLARAVTAPALVLCGARDPLNRRASAALAGALPSGELRLLPKAGPRWLVDQPQLLSGALNRICG